MKWTVLIFVVAAMMVVLSTGAALAASFAGTEGQDRIEGTDRTDKISGLGGGYGADEVYGNVGDDVLIDHPDKNTDVLYGGSGDNEVQLRDFPAVRDEIYCGSGRDKAYVDRLDEVSGCEIVKLP